MTGQSGPHILLQQDNCTMTSFHYNYQNPSVCCFLVQGRAIVFSTAEGLTNLNKKAKTKRILVVVVKCRHRENGLLMRTNVIRKTWHLSC